MKKLSLFYCIVSATLFNTSFIFSYNKGIRKDRINIKEKNKSLQQQVAQDQTELVNLHEQMANCTENLNMLLTHLNVSSPQEGVKKVDHLFFVQKHSKKLAASSKAIAEKHKKPRYGIFI